MDAKFTTLHLSIFRRNLFKLNLLSLMIVLTFVALPTLSLAQVLATSNICSSSPVSYSTIATTYGPLSPGTGNCGFPGGTYDPNNYCAIISADYQNGMACGACIDAQASTGGSVTLMVVDSCPSCSTANQLDLGPQAWNTLTGNAPPGIANITWHFIQCPLSMMTGDPSGDIMYQWKSGCSASYNPIQFLDMNIPVTAVGFSTSSTGPYTALVLGANGVGGNEYWGTSNGNLDNGGTGPYYFDVTNACGQSTTIGPLGMGSCSTTLTTANQFNGTGPTPTPGPPTATFTITSTPAPMNTVVVNGISFTNCGIGQPSADSQKQELLAQGTGLDYVMASAQCGQPLNINLPAGATPVTAFLYVEYNNMSAEAPKTTQIQINGYGTGTGTAAGAVTYANWVQTWYSVRYSVSPASLMIGANTVNTSGNGDTCKGLGLMVLYKDPAQTTNNVVAIADGEFAWHYEENGQIAYGYPPYDSQMDWSCLGMTCGSYKTRFSVLGGADECNGNSDGFMDQIETWGSGPPGPPTNNGTAYGGNQGSPAVWSGPPGALNCKVGSGPDEIQRDYYPPTSAFLNNGQSFEWGFDPAPPIFPTKSTYWQQALIAQYICNPQTYCAVTQTFNKAVTGTPPGWIVGAAPPDQGSWAEGTNGVSFVGGPNGDCMDENNQLLNTQVASGPGTITANYCQTNQHQRPNQGGIMWDVNVNTGAGYEVQFDGDNCANADSSLTFNVYGPAGTGTGNITKTQTVNLPANSVMCATCPTSTWIQVIISGSNFIVSVGAVQGTYSFSTTFTDSSYSSGMVGISDYGCTNDTFKSFQWNGVCNSTPTPTPTNTPTPTPTPTRTPTPTPTPTYTPTPTPTPTNTPTPT